MVGGALSKVLLVASASGVAVSAVPAGHTLPSSTPQALSSAGHARKLTVHNHTILLAPSPKVSARVGFVSLNRDSWDCGAFAWDNNQKEYGNHGYTFRAETEEDARAEALKHCQEEVPDNACEVKSSWCGKTKCIALAYSNDWQWYAYNSNPVTATKAMMYALDDCTQNACNAVGWGKACNSGRPLCYIEKVFCGSEAMGASYSWFDEEAGTLQFTSRDESIWVGVGEGYDAELFARPELTLLAKTLPYKMFLPQKAVDHTVLDDSPAATDPAYVPEEDEDKNPKADAEAPKPEEENEEFGGDEEDDDTMSANSGADMANTRRSVFV